MAPLPPESTPRYIVHTTVGGKEHVQLWRSQPPASPASMELFLIDVWTAVSPMLLLTQITAVGFIADGSTIENAVSMPSFVGQFYGTGSPSNIQSVGFLDFVGRSAGGRRARYAFWCPDFTDESFRVTGAERTEVDDVIDLIQTNGVDLVCIDGLVPVMKPYANWGYNAHWQRASRS